MPDGHARGEVHSERGVEDVGVSRPHAPAVIRPGIARAGRIASPVGSCPGLELLLIRVAEVSPGVGIDVVVDADVELVGMRGCGAGDDQVVGQTGALGCRVVTQQLGANRVGRVAGKIGEDVARNRVADETGSAPSPGPDRVGRRSRSEWAVS